MSPVTALRASLRASLAAVLLLLTALDTSTAQDVVGDLALGRTFTASSTCGLTSPQTFCTLHLPTTSPDTNGGRDCFTCDESDPQNSHSPRFLSDNEFDGTRTWWQSESGTGNVTLELDLRAAFSFRELVITFRSPRPAALVLERSRDFGASYEVYRFFSDDCEGDFGVSEQSGPETVDDVTCTSEFSSIEPLTGGQVTYTPLPPSLGAPDYNSLLVVNQTTLTNLRIRLLRLNVLPGDDLSDPATMLSYQYAIYGIEVRGSCFCNGRSLTCGPPPNIKQPEPDMVHPQCRCTGNTQGANCEGCVVGFYKNSSAALSDPNLCIPCGCSPVGSEDTLCDQDTGQCTCLTGFTGLACDACPPSFFLSEAESSCIPCSCNEQGSTSSECGSEGQCECKVGVRGRGCDECKPDQYNFSSDGCTPCECFRPGSARDDGVCGNSGECECVEGVRGRRCDECPASTVGPDKNMVSVCTDCFCNGYSKRCSPQEGWYQASVVSGFDDTGIAMEGFRSDGSIFADRGCLEFDSQGSTLYISLPNSFLGDRRTSYSQKLTLNLSIPNMAPDDRCHVFVEVIGRSSRYRQVALIAELPSPSNQPQLIEFSLVPGEGVQVDLWFWKRPATQRDIRQILANIRQLRLKVTFEPGTSPLTVKLCGVSLGYATNDPADPFISVPTTPVRYVERCDCPLNREGPRCEFCSPGFTTDPSFGGEFARCVRCFCNFHSTSCDPVSGECFDCGDNAEGPDCEGCAPGYFRESPLRIDPCVLCECSANGTVGGACRAVSGVCECMEGYAGLRCDECAEGYWSPSPGQCIACECDSEGSLSQACNQATGVCDCLPRVIGDRCDRCQGNTTDFFPSCEPCDECTGQWQAMINPLRADVEAALELARMISMTPGPEGVPILVVLVNTLNEVREILNTSGADSELAGNVTELHRRLCELTNQTQGLFERTVAVDDEITRLEGDVGSFEDETTRLASLLLELQEEFETLSVEFRNISIPDLDPQPYLTIAEEGEERSAMAEQLISQNVSVLLSLTENLLEEFNGELNSSGLLERQIENLRILSLISQRVSEYESFLVQANAELCGGGGANATSGELCDGECGGVGCDNCGGSPQCNGLVTMAAQAVVVSREALEIAENLRNQTLSRLAVLRTLFANISALRNETLDAELEARRVQTRAEGLWIEVRGLRDDLQRQLLDERIDPDVIEEVERETLSLALVVTRDEFLDILVAINNTVDMIFSRFGVNSTDLTRRAESALERAKIVNSLAEEVAANVSVVQSVLAELELRETAIEANLTLAETTNSESQTTIDQTSASLDQTNTSLLSTGARLSSLSARLAQLETNLTETLARLPPLRLLTEEAENASAAAELSSRELEAEFVRLRDDADGRVRRSQEQLQEAEDLRNRTAALVERTSQQLLLEENLERRERELLQEQQFIRGDVQRLSLQLEELSQLIQVHIARNTACLDFGSLQKR